MSMKVVLRVGLSFSLSLLRDYSSGVGGWGGGSNVPSDAVGFRTDPTQGPPVLYLSPRTDPQVVVGFREDRWL